jgi:hypothetical protein
MSEDLKIFLALGLILFSVSYYLFYCTELK